MHRRPVLLAIVLLLATSCGSGAPETQARDALSAARARIADGDHEAAYRSLLRIHREFPGTPSEREAFPLAAALYKRLYFRDRYASPDAEWVVDGAAALFAWLETYVSGDGETAFPQAEAEALFIGLHYGFIREFQAFAAGRPKLAAWRLTVQKDNGIVESVRAERREGTAPAAPGSPDTLPPVG